MTFRRIVFSGGGTKGFTYLGCHKALSELKILDDIESVAGSSIGAVMATLIALKYTSDELYDFVTTLTYDHFKSLDFWGALHNLGLDTGEKIYSFLLALIKYKFKNNQQSPPNNPTFQDLWKLTGIELNILVTHLNSYDAVCFNHLTHPTESVAMTLRKSVAYPWAIAPVITSEEIIDESTGICNDFWVDGGVASNFPIEIYPDSSETLGFLLEDIGSSHQIDRNPESFSYHIIQACCCQLTKWKLKSFKNTVVIHLKVTDVAALSLQLETEMKQKLYDQGYENTMKILQQYKDQINKEKDDDNNDNVDNDNDEQISKI